MKSVQIRTRKNSVFGHLSRSANAQREICHNIILSVLLRKSFNAEK